MVYKLTFDSAIEILEITDISKVDISDLSRIVKKAKSRWHPDRVARFQDEAEIDKYTKSFQLIEPAAELIKSYLNGEYKIGDKYEQKQERVYEEPSEVIRKNAVHIQEMLKKVWEGIKSTKYKHVEREQVLSDGFSLKELLDRDFKEDLVIPSIISFIFGPLALIIPIFIAALINEVLGIVAVTFLGIHLIFCLLGFLPLSRFWLPDFFVPIMLWFIDFGVGFYFKLSDREDNNWVKFFLAIPYWLALAVKYLVLFPINGIAKLIIGNKVVGVVKENISYYAGLADWYIKEIISKDHNQMNEEELFDLSYLYKEFKDFRNI
jgi:hypothetical protein